MKDFLCPNCCAEVEELVENDVASIPCPWCKTNMENVWLKAPHLASECIPSYPGCKAQRAGYMHTHGDRPAEKIQSGYGGSQGPK
jgi:Zn-finger nucleic acid-binding protein